MGRGAGSNGLDTPKRDLGSQLTQITSFDLSEEKVVEAEDEDEEVQTTPQVSKSQAQMPVDLPVMVSLQDGPIKNFSSSEKEDVQEKEEFSIEEAQVTGAGGKESGDSKDVEMKFTEISKRGALAGRSRGRGRGGRKYVGVTSASKKDVDEGIKRGVLGGVDFRFKSFIIPRSMLTQRQETPTDVRKDLDPIKFKSPIGNGDTVDLSDTDSEEEAKMGSSTVNEMGNGLLSVSQQPEPPLDLDSDMQVDLTPDKTNSGSESVTLSNGDIFMQTNDDNSCTLMEVETSPHPVKVAPVYLGPIAVSSTQHCWALRDHWLYCQTGTWEKEALEEELGPEADEKIRDEENQEKLTDIIHEFLESFYIKYGGFIPLSETDVLEYLKEKGNSDLSDRGVDVKAQMSRYRAALASAPVAGFMVTYNKHTLSLEDLGTLEEQNWLNDQIINMYGELIMEATQHKVHFFNSFFHKQLVAKGYDGVKRWTKKVDLFSKTLLLIPIHLEIHWSLVTVTMATKTISYYDSQGIVFRHTTDNILKYILSEAKEKKQAGFQKGWKITIIKGIPQQKNDSDCGVFVLEYCRCLSMKQPLKFSQEDMPQIRKRIYKELCNCHLND